MSLLPPEANSARRGDFSLFSLDIVTVNGFYKRPHLWIGYAVFKAPPHCPDNNEISDSIIATKDG
jgi:hypothetical protein